MPPILLTKRLGLGYTSNPGARQQMILFFKAEVQLICSCLFCPSSVPAQQGWESSEVGMPEAGGYIGTMEKKMEATTFYYGIRV